MRCLQMRRPLVLWTLPLLSVVAAAQEPATAKEEAAVRDVVRRYVEARELRDPSSIGKLFAEDADQLVSSGEWRRGRDELVKGMLASSASNSGKRTITVERVRFVAANVAIADGRYEIAGESGVSSRSMWATFVMTRNNGGWIITAIRNMLPAQGR